MKLIHAVLVIVVEGLIISGCSQTNSDIRLENDVDSLSYFLGIFSGMTLKESGYTQFNSQHFDSAVQVVFQSRLVTENDFIKSDSIISWYIKNGKHQITLQQGRTFLEENQKRKEIKVTDSGLQYEIIREGSGPKPQIGDSIKIIFTGTTTEGVAFMNMNDYSGGPRTILFKAGTRGGIQALRMMPEGSHYKFYLPTELAYGKNPLPGGPLEANMAVIYDVELLKVIPQK
jgi:FKBP-type peptidyl-prolyl cis-trans isomerase FklB